MTLATVPRYDSDGVSEVGEHAVVVGGSMAGLLTARILSDGFKEVTVVEKDPMPDEPVARRGVPQSRHIHVLMEAGRATLEDLFPGYCEDLISAGGLVIDGVSDVSLYGEGNLLADGSERLPMYCATRPLIEQVVRQRVSNLDRVHVRDDCQFTDYLVDDAVTTVEGVVVRDDDSEKEEVSADLVVDATGRTSRTPTWLEEQGYTPPDVDEVRVDLSYSTAFVERPVKDRRAFMMLPSPPLTRGGVVSPVEENRWIVTMAGVHGDDPPTDREEFTDFAATLPIPVEQILDEHPWDSEDIDHYPFPSSLRRRYEDVDRFPEGLVVVGDALVSFNPIYGQGMSMAALEALQLHHTLATSGQEDLALRFFDRAEEVIDVAWMMAVGADFQFSQTEGPKPRGTELFNRYLSRLIRKAHTDGELRVAFHRVIMMEQPPTSLLSPQTMWRVLRPAR